MQKLEWTPDDRFALDGVNFRSVGIGNFYGALSNVDEFILFKPKRLVQRHIALLRKLKPRHILELGIWQGGSAVFLQRYTGAKVVALDISKHRIAAVDEHVERHALEDRLRMYYGVNQADSTKLSRLAGREFGTQSLDLVVDDASHLLDETRSSFNTLFPLLRPGGAYVIEDWAWAHVQVGENADDARGLYPDKEPLTKLVFELALACSSTAGLIRSIELDRYTATVWRGPATIKRRGFDISGLCAARGRRLIAPGAG
jgi:SAM-dependent methyltransferase